MEFKLGSIWLSDKLGENIANQFKGKMKAGAGHDSSKIKTGTSNVELVDIDGDGYLDILEGQFHTVSGLWSGSGFKLYRFNGNCFEDATNKFFQINSVIETLKIIFLLHIYIILKWQTLIKTI